MIRSDPINIVAVMPARPPAPSLAFPSYLHNNPGDVISKTATHDALTRISTVRHPLECPSGMTALYLRRSPGHRLARGGRPMLGSLLRPSIFDSCDNPDSLIVCEWARRRSTTTQHCQGAPQTWGNERRPVSTPQSASLACGSRVRFGTFRQTLPLPRQANLVAVERWTD